MLKVTAVVSLMLIVTCSHADSKRHKKEASSTEDFDQGSTLWAASLSCDSCGSECASACGTRHFRSCCFNYLRRKRGPEVKFLSQIPNENHEPQQTRPIFIVESLPEPWTSNLVTDLKPYLEDPVENRLQFVYDA